VGKKKLEPQDLTESVYIELKQKNLSDGQIARLYQLTIHQVAYRKRKWGLLGINVNDSRRTQRKQLKDKYIELTNAGWTHYAIAEEFGMGTVTLTKFKKEWGIFTLPSDIGISRISERGVEEVSIGGIYYKRVD
jgi:hypothetical protein